MTPTQARTATRWWGKRLCSTHQGRSARTRYEWDAGDGRGRDATADPIVRVTYDEPGLYRAFLAVFDDLGRRRVDTVNIRVTDPLVHSPRRSGSVAVWPEREEVAVVSPDSGELVVFRYASDRFALVQRIAVPADPRTVTVWDDAWAVVCQGGGAVARVRVDGTVETLGMGPARPFGAIAIDGEGLFVTLAATGEVARIESTAGGLTETARFAAGPDPRGIALLPDARIVVTRWRSPDEGGELRAMALDGTESETLVLAFDPQPSSDTESGGVPSYLEQALVSPTGRLLVVPSLQAAIGEGSFVSPRPLTHETTVRAAISFVELPDGTEAFTRRKLFDDRGFASAGVFSSRGDFLYLAMRGARSIERRDVLAGLAGRDHSGCGVCAAGARPEPR